MVDDVAGRQFFQDVRHGDAHMDHEDHDVIHEVRDLIDGLFLVIPLGGDDDFGVLLTDLLQDLVDALLEEIGGVGTFRTALVAADQQVIEALDRELMTGLALEDRVFEAGVGAEVAGRAVLFDDDDQRILVTVGRDGDDVLIVVAGRDQKQVSSFSMEIFRLSAFM